MYLFYLTSKTPNGILAIVVLIYSIILAIAAPFLERKNKIALWVFSVLPLVGAIVHFGIYGVVTFDKYKNLYIEMLLPLLTLLPSGSKVRAIKNIVGSVLGAVLCFVFLLNAASYPMVHNFSRYNYSESFKKMLDVMEREYCLGSWKCIDYDALQSEYLPKVEEAEKVGDELAYARIITEVAYSFCDSHVNVELSENIDLAVRECLAGNDYGLSMVRLDDGSVIAVLVEPDSELISLGIHDGTVILQWDGQEINEALKNTKCVFPTLQFPVESNEDLFRPMFLAGKGGESVDITFVNDAGEKQTINAKRTDNYENRLTLAYLRLLHADTDWRNYYAAMLDDKCGYLQMTSESFDFIKDNISVMRGGYYPKLTEYYAGLIEGLFAQGMEYLVIDIRNNGGGYDSVAGALASLFTDEKKHMVSFGYEDSNGYHIKENLYIFPDGRYKDLPVAVLTNADCMSAGDGMLKFLGECDNVTLMGITSSAGVNQNNGGIIYLTDNICVNYPVFLSLSTENEPLIDTDYTRENRIPLDVTIPLTKEMALEMFAYSLEVRDVELEYTVDYLERKVNGKAAEQDCLP